MAEVAAGFVCGYVLALIATPVGAVALLRARLTSPTLRAVLPEGTSLVAVSVILHVFVFMSMTAVGILLGLVLGGLEDRTPGGGLASPNQAFTVFVLAATAIAVGPVAAYAARLRVPLLAGGLVFAGIFGWLMPYLAHWGLN